MNNVKKARISRNISQKELSITLGIAQPTISNWETGRMNPSNKHLLQLSDMLKYSTDYILGKSNDPKANIEKKAVRIPVLGRIPAGIAVNAIEDILDYEEVTEEWANGGKEYFGLKIKGDSMSPKYLDGDIVLFLIQNTCDSGQDCAVMVNGEDATFKKVVKQANGVVLQPINTSMYEPVFYSNKECEELPVRVLGIAKEIRRTL